MVRSEVEHEGLSGGGCPFDGSPQTRAGRPRTEPGVLEIILAPLESLCALSDSPSAREAQARRGLLGRGRQRTKAQVLPASPPRGGGTGCPSYSLEQVARHVASTGRGRPVFDLDWEVTVWSETVCVAAARDERRYSNGRHRNLLMAHAILWAAVMIATSLMMSKSTAPDSLSLLLIIVLVPSWCVRADSPAGAATGSRRSASMIAC